MARVSVPLYMVLVLLCWEHVSSQGVCLDDRMDLVVIVDSSDSLAEENFELVLGFVEVVLDSAAIDTGNVNVGLMTYGTSSDIRFYLGEHITRVEVIDAVYSIEYSGGNSNTADALLAARTKVFNTREDRPDAKNVIILVTDGYSDINAHRTAEEAALTRQAGIQIYVLGVGLRDTSEIDQIASKPLDIYRHTAKDFSNAAFMKNQMFPQERCYGDMSLVTENGIQDLNLDSENQDLIFLLHFSDGMYKNEFKQILDFMTSLLERADIDSGSLRVGAALYREEGVTIFDLNAYQTKKETLEAVEMIPYNFKTDRANLAAGINTVRDKMFADSAGDRPDVPNGVIIITDSNSNVNADGIGEASSELKDTGTTIFSVGIGLENPDEIVSVASKQEFSYVLNDVGQLPALTESFRDKMPSLNKNGPLPVVEETIVPEIFQPLESTSDLKNSESADIVVLFHAGNKVKAKHFNKGLKLFMSKLFEKAQVDSGMAKVAIINYGSKATEIFGLNEYSKKSDLRKSIQKWKPKKYRNSHADLADGLRLARTQTFTKARGSRLADGVPSALILITDMRSSSDLNIVTMETNQLKNMGVKVFTLGVDKADNNELISLTSDPKNENHQSVGSFLDLVKGDNIIDHVTSKIRACKYAL